MTEITLARHAWARIALAGVNTQHPGPLPRGKTTCGNSAHTTQDRMPKFLPSDQWLFVSLEREDIMHF